MAIQFPGSPSHEQVWPEEGDLNNLKETKGVIFQYDKFVNAWDIVGPDNIATTDWVLGQKKDDTTNLERAYDLVIATNDVGIDEPYNTKQSQVCDDLFENTLRGGVSAPNQDPTLGGDGKTVEEVLEYAFPEWAACVAADGLGTGSVAFIGYDHFAADANNNDGTLKTSSSKYSELTGFVVNDTSRDDEVVNWYDNVRSEDTLELSFEGSTGNTEYAIYRITQVDRVDDTRIRARILFVGASHPDNDYRLTGQKTYYQFKTYSRSVTTAGATFDGPIRVNVDDDRALSAKSRSATQDSFNVDTVGDRVMVSDNYNALLGSAGYDDNNLVCTFGYVTARLGEDTPGSRGPWLPLTGGIVTNTIGVVIKQQIGGSIAGKTFTIRGKTSSGSQGNSDVLTVKSYAGLDYLAAASTVNTPEDALLNKSQIQALINSNADGTSYLPIGGGKMTGRITGIELTPSSEDEAASKAYADTKEYVHNGTTSEKGRIWTNGSTLFFNPYS